MSDTDNTGNSHYTANTDNWGNDADALLEVRSGQSEQHPQDDPYATWADSLSEVIHKDNQQLHQQLQQLEHEQREQNWNDYRRMLRRVNVDPRTVGFIYGKRRANVRAISADIRDSTGFTIFMEYVNVDNGSYGYWKCLSKSMPAIALAETWLKEKEWECVEAINSGSYKPWKYPAYNQHDNRTDAWGLNGWDYDNDNTQYYGW